MVRLNPARKHGFLNQENREFILDDWDSSGDSARQRRYRIRQQFIGGFRDLYYLSFLPESDRERIFSGLTERHDADDVGDELLEVLFQVLYTDLSRTRFEFALEDGIEAAIVDSRVDEDGIYPDIDVHLEIQEGDFGEFDVEELVSRIRSEDSWGRVDREHVERLYQAGAISHTEYAELRENTRRVLSDEESRLHDLEWEEERLEAARTWNEYKHGWSVNDVLLLRKNDYLTLQEATAILDGGEDRCGLRYIAHCLRCAYESDDWDGPVIGREKLPQSPADIRIRDSGPFDELSEWHQKSKGNEEKQRIQSVQRGSEQDPSVLSRCVDFEKDESSPSVLGEDFSTSITTTNFEPEHDPQEFPEPEELTPTHIEALHDKGIISEQRYYELLSDRLEVAPDLLSDDQVRSLFAAGEIDIRQVRNVLDPKDLSEQYIADLQENGRITHEQYLDMLTLKYRQGGSLTLSDDRVEELLEEDRIDPEASYVNSAQLHDLYQFREISAERYLDILEMRFEEDSDLLIEQDLRYLYEDGRITREEFIESDKTPSREFLEGSLIPSEKQISLIDYEEMTEEEIEQAEREKEYAYMDMMSDE